MNGLGERTGNANLDDDHRQPRAEDGPRGAPHDQLAKLTETAHFVDELLNRAPNPRQPYVGKLAFAHKGGLHVAGVREDASTFEHVDPAMVGNKRDLLDQRAEPAAARLREKAAAAGIALDDAGAARLTERVKELEHGGYQFEAADGSFELLMRKEAGEYEPLFRLESWRVHRRAARRRQGRDRGDDQDLGRWRALRAHRRGQRPGQRARPRAARRDRRDPPAPQGHRARQLQGPHPRRDQGHGRRHARAPRRLRRPRFLGLDRGQREHHRGVVAGARGLARVRRAAGSQARRAA